MESQQRDFWIKFHKEMAAEERLHRIEGAIMLPMVLIGPFVILWIMGMLLGQ